MRPGALAEGVAAGRPERAATETSACVPRVPTLGRYRVIAELARGGMGIVYLAMARGPGSFSKVLVLKELKREFLGDPEIVRMFLEEARLAARLNHPNVVHTIEAGSEGNRHYIAMEYVDGQSLHRVVSRAKRIGRGAPFEWQVAVLASALEGLAYAHSACDYDGKPLGIVHRDVSPHNIVVGYDGQVKVLDFGIAKATAVSAETQSGLLKGKVAYMAPEQAAGAPVDPRADVFAFGVMLWEAATGRRFWAGLENDMQILRALLDRQSGTSRDRTMAEIPGQLQHVIAKATAPDPAKRYGCAMVLLAEMREALASCGVPKLGRPEIGAFPQQIFAEDRARLRASIEDALELHRRPDFDDLPTTAVDDAPVERQASSPFTPVRSDVRAMSVPVLAPAGPNETYVSAIAPPPAALRPSRSGARARAWAVLAAATVGAAAATALLALHSSSEPRSAPRADAPVGTTPPVVSAPSATGERVAETAPERVHVIVRATPAEARIVVDRQLVVDNPCVMTFPKDGESHSVRVEADGYAPREDVFDATADLTLVIGLEHRDVGSRPAVARTTAPRPAVVEAPAQPAIAAAPVAPVAPVASTRWGVTSPQPTLAAAPPSAAPAADSPQHRIDLTNPYGD